MLPYSHLILLLFYEFHKYCIFTAIKYYGAIDNEKLDFELSIGVWIHFSDIPFPICNVLLFLLNAGDT